MLEPSLESSVKKMTYYRFCDYVKHMNSFYEASFTPEDVLSQIVSVNVQPFPDKHVKLMGHTMWEIVCEADIPPEILREKYISLLNLETI